MRTVKLSEAKDKLSELVAAAEAGEDVVISRHGHPAVRLVPVTKAMSGERSKQLWEELAAIRSDVLATSGSVTTEELIAWKSEGRR